MASSPGSAASSLPSLVFDPEANYKARLFVELDKTYSTPRPPPTDMHFVPGGGPTGGYRWPWVYNRGPAGGYHNGLREGGNWVRWDGKNYLDRATGQAVKIPGLKDKTAPRVGQSGQLYEWVDRPEPLALIKKEETFEKNLEKAARKQMKKEWDEDGL